MTEPNSSFVHHPPGYRLPGALRLGPVRLEIADLERSLAYYESVLGLRVIECAERRAALGPFGEEKTLVELHEVPGAREHPYNRRLGLYHFAILLPTRADLGRFVAHLAHINAYAGQADHFVSEAFYLRDPDGLGIEVYADRPRSEWPVVNGKLEMGLDPVDMETLLASAGGSKWTGMPAGTVIGHVHLHVGDLEEGTNFYHRGLGFDLTASLPSALFLSAGGYHHHLGTNTWSADGARPKHGDARLLEWTIVLPSAADADAAAKSVAGAGYATSREAADHTLTDPWGTRFRLTASGGR
ncbi:MAG: VOC family protein [Gemmatimonadota bacterium]|nr:VOC family protein [Gemmatimonadota bacterium]